MTQVLPFKTTLAIFVNNYLFNLEVKEEEQFSSNTDDSSSWNVHLFSFPTRDYVKTDV